MSTLKLIVRHPVPSLNKLFAMNHWQRHKERNQTQLALLSALQVSAKDLSIQTTLLEGQNTLLMACDTLASYLTTDRKIFHSKLSKGKSCSQLRSGQKSKS